MKNIKYILLIAILACVIILPTHVSAAPDVKVTVNGQYVTFTDQKPFIDKNDRTMVPVRAPMEAIGCTVDWDADKRQAIIAKGETKAVFTINSKTYTVNGQNKTMDTQAVIVNSRTAFPIRYAAEAMGATVGWDSATYTVIITQQVPAEVQTVEFRPGDAKGKKIIISTAGYEIGVTNGEGGKGTWVYINSYTGADIKVVCTNADWNKYYAPVWTGGYDWVRTDLWRDNYALRVNISPKPTTGDKAVLNVYGKVNGQETIIATVVKYF